MRALSIVGRLSLVVLGIVILIGTLRYFGLCEKKLRFLSDKEKIDVAVEYILASYPPVLSDIVEENGVRKIGLYRPRQPIPYKDKEDFFKRNPDCCEVVTRYVPKRGEGNEVSFEDRITGRISSFVRVKYIVRYLDEAGKEHSEIAEIYPAITNCGYLWNGI